MRYGCVPSLPSLVANNDDVDAMVVGICRVDENERERARSDSNFPQV